MWWGSTYCGQYCCTPLSSACTSLRTSPVMAHAPCKSLATQRRSNTATQPRRVWRVAETSVRLSPVVCVHRRPRTHTRTRAHKVGVRGRGREPKEPAHSEKTRVVPWRTAFVSSARSSLPSSAAARNSWSYSPPSPELSSSSRSTRGTKRARQGRKRKCTVVRTTKTARTGKASRMNSCSDLVLSFAWLGALCRTHAPPRAGPLPGATKHATPVQPAAVRAPMPRIHPGCSCAALRCSMLRVRTCLVAHHHRRGAPAGRAGWGVPCQTPS